MSAQPSKRQRVSAQPKIIKAAEQFNPALELAHEDAEQAVIGAVLQEPSIYPSISEVLQPADFYMLFHGYVWHAFEKITERNEAIDLLTVSDELEKAGRLDGDYTIGKLSNLMSAAPDVSNAEVYAKKVRDAATRIRILMAAEAMKERAQDKTVSSVESIIDDCNRLLFEATDQRIQSTDTSIRAVANAFYEAVEQGMTEKQSPGICSGFQDLDELLKGFSQDEVNIIAGSEGMGKTSLMLSMIRQMALRGKKVALFTLEMTQQEIIRIFTAMETGIPKDALKAFQLTPFQWTAFVEASGKVANWPVHIIDEFPALTPLQLRRRLRKMLTEEAIDIVFVDGLWLMEASEPNPRRDRPQAVFEIMRDLNVLARDFNVPVVVAHQYNGKAFERGQKDRRPTLFDLAESAGVRRNAQVILGLYRDAYYGIDSDQDVTEVHILKDRNGRSQGKHIELMYDFGRACFVGTVKREIHVGLDAGNED